jgi:hypothetical protein
VFEKRVLRRIFGSQEERNKRRLDKIAYEELHKLDSSPSKIRMIKSKRVK